MTKSRGPRTDPWGTPQEEVWKEEMLYGDACKMYTEKLRHHLRRTTRLNILSITGVSVTRFLLHMSINVNVNMKRFDLFRNKLCEKTI